MGALARHSTVLWAVNCVSSRMQQQPIRCVTPGGRSRFRKKNREENLQRLSNIRKPRFFWFIFNPFPLRVLVAWGIWGSTCHTGYRNPPTHGRICDGGIVQRSHLFAACSCGVRGFFFCLEDKKPVFAARDSSFAICSCLTGLVHFILHSQPVWLGCAGMEAQRLKLHTTILCLAFQGCIALSGKEKEGCNLPIT